MDEGESLRNCSQVCFFFLHIIGHSSLFELRREGASSILLQTRKDRNGLGESDHNTFQSPPKSLFWTTGELPAHPSLGVMDVLALVSHLSVPYLSMAAFLTPNPVWTGGGAWE